MSLDVYTAVKLIKHFQLTREVTFPLGLTGDFDAENQNDNSCAASSYMLGYMCDDIAKAIHDAGGMASAW